jgi:serine/threonine-protein kinase
MQIPDAIRSSDTSVSQVSNHEPLTAGTVAAESSDSPTVVRNAGSTARRLQAQGQVHVQAVAPSVLAQPGEVIGPFVLEEAIGAGGMGAVFRAIDAQLGRHVALKMLPLDQAGDPEIIQRFYQEGRSAAQLDHENIARVYSIGQDGPHHYIAFEYIEGITVRRRVDENGPLPVADAVDITLQIGQALVHAAARGVVHRDIKPSNIILTPHGRAKLVDMGLARRFEREADHGLTQSGMTLGTFDYISPEQARDPRDVDVRSDLYSLGCTLFHMLSGKPPFPGGTVLQKLLQHQEEPPPEIRGLNPDVPPELARLLSKLLAKDRDRRYQSPEQLVRDLLVIAGQLGLAINPPEQHAWMVKGHRVTWERHLVWFYPALAFVLVVTGLIWWGRELSAPASVEPGLDSSRPVRGNASPKVRVSAPAGAPVPSSLAGTDVVDRSQAIAAVSRTIAVRPADDLLSVIATAPAHAVITLTEDGPYFLGGRAAGLRGSHNLVNRDLTIRAASADVRPVLRLAAEAVQGDQTSTAILPFSGGNVTIEGLAFELDATGDENRVAAISTEDTALNLLGCMFRQSAVRPGRNRAALRIGTLKTAAPYGDRPPAVSIDCCHFDGGQVAIVVEGPADLLLRDCTLGPGSPTIWIDNSQKDALVPAVVRLRNSSVMATAGPVFEIEGSLARIQVEDCVIAAGGSSLPTLVAVDDPHHLNWRGRGNLYGRMRAYLESTPKGEGAQFINDFNRWKETATEVRELDWALASTPVWRSTQARRDLIIEQDNPTQAFQLASAFLQSSVVGARRGPYGERLVDTIVPAGRWPDSAIARTGHGRDRIIDSGRLSATGDTQSVRSEPIGEPPPQGSENITTVAAKPSATAAAEADDAASLSAMPPMTTTLAGSSGGHPAEIEPRLETGATGPPRLHGDAPATAPAAEPSRPTEIRAPRVELQDSVIRTPEQFTIALNRLGPQGGRLTIAGNADLELPLSVLAGSGSWQIVAESGPRRPRLRFRPSLFTDRSTSWSVLLNLHSGSLHLQGLDLLIPSQDPEALRSGGHQAAIGVAPGSELELANCTITIAGHSPSAAVVVVQPGAADNASAPKEPTIHNAVIKIRDSFIRSAGDAIIVASGRTLALEFHNSLVATDGSLLHAVGSSRVDHGEAELNVTIDHTLARCRDGLVVLESTLEEPGLPVADITARSSIFSTAGQAPLFRVDGQGQMESLRDRILWNAERVAYDEITIYRRDQILQTGVSPRDFNRSDWKTAFEPKDELPVTEGPIFLKRIELRRPASSLTKDDLKLDPHSPALDRGCDLNPIPSSPATDF